MSDERKTYSRAKCVYTLSVNGDCFASGGFRRVRALYDAMQAALDPVPSEYRPAIIMAIGEYYPYGGELKQEGGDFLGI